MAGKPKTKAALELERLQHEVRKTKAEADTAELEARSEARTELSQLANEGNHRIYHFIGQVTDKTVWDCVSTVGRWARRAPGEPITIIFNSPGGGVSPGLALYDQILEWREQGHHITTIARGWAASMGSILLQAGDDRVVGPNAYVMVHEISDVMAGKFADLEDDLETGRRMQDRLATILAERSIYSKEQIKRKMKKKDVWLDAQETIAWGLADRIG